MRYKKQKGASILLTILIMAALLTIAVGISRLSLGEIKLSRDISKTLIAYYAADAGIEAAIYYERAELEGAGGEISLGLPAITEQDAINDGYLTNNDLCLDYPANNICFAFEIYTDDNLDPDMRFIQSKGFYRGVQRAVELDYELN